MISRTEARTILENYTKGASLLRHARSVELVMEALGKHFEEDADKFAITGLLHDADYEMYPEEHPNIIVKHLNDMGETEIAHAIAGHYTKWNVPRNSILDKSIIAADELTGFIIAAALIRPTKIEGMSVKSVKKKLKNLKFAAKVDREEVYKGAALLGWEMGDLISFIIKVLEENKEELKIAAAS
jgi:predicted hydrolase (HD superfamily)